jgi:hypothetical protein
MTIVSCLCAFLGYVVMIARVLTEEKAQLRGLVVGVERIKNDNDYYNSSWPITSLTALTSASLTFPATRQLRYITATRRRYRES